MKDHARTDRHTGIKAIKVWPFDAAAARNRNQFVTPQDINGALKPVQKLREVFGAEIGIAVEFHAQWNVASAISHCARR